MSLYKDNLIILQKTVHELSVEDQSKQRSIIKYKSYANRGFYKSKIQSTKSIGAEARNPSSSRKDSMNISSTRQEEGPIPRKQLKRRGLFINTFRSNHSNSKNNSVAKIKNSKTLNTTK